MQNIQSLEDKGNLIFGGSLFPNNGAFLLFNCKDETIPYDFVKSVSKVTKGLLIFVGLLCNIVNQNIKK